MKSYQASAVGLYNILINERRDKHAKLRGGLALDEICKKTMTTNGYVIIDIVWLGGWDHGAGKLTSKPKLDNLATFILASFFSKKTTLPDKGIRFAH